MTHPETFRLLGPADQQGLSVLRKSLRLAAIGTAALMSTGTAWAQSGDIVIMRKAMGARPAATAPVTTPAPTPSPTPAPTPTPAPLPPADWTVGEWTDVGGPACTADAPQRRTVACQADGRTVDASRCTGAAPEADRTSPRYDACSYAWKPGEWSSYSSACSADAVRTRSAECLREGQVKVAEARCSDVAKPETVEHAAIYTGCSHSWKTGDFLDPGASCTAQETQTRPVTCVRDIDATIADDAACSGQQRPDATRRVADYAACQPYWDPATAWSAWSSTCSNSATRTRQIGCFRYETECDPASGVWVMVPNAEHGCYRKIDDAECRSYPTATREGHSPETDSTETAANLTSCGYVATETAWGSCSYVTRPGENRTLYSSRAVTCTRSDDATVDAALCSRDAVEYRTCTADGAQYDRNGIRGMVVPNRIGSEEAVVALNGTTTLTYQGDGNLCIYSSQSHGGGIWCSMAHGYAPGRMEFVDGAIRQIAADGSVFWQTGASGNPGSSLVLMDSGRLVVTDTGGTIIWSNF